MSADVEVVTRIEPLIDLERSGALTKTGLVIPPTITLERYEALGHLLGEMHQVVQWAIGDWLNAGEHLFNDEWSHVSESLGIGEDARMQYQRVARQIPIERRRPELSFSHHRCVAAMKDERRRDELLEQAVVKGWSVVELLAHKRDEPIGELPEPSLDFRYRHLRAAALRVWDQKQEMVGNDAFYIEAAVMGELGAALST